VEAAGETLGTRARVVSDTSGRLRIRLRAEARSPETMERIAARIGGRPGISRVTTNSTTGSVTVSYDPATRSREEIVDLLRDAGVAIIEIAPDDGRERSRPAQTVISAFGGVDDWLARTTREGMDLRTAFPFALAALAIWRITSEGLGLARAPGYVFLWYMWDSFYKLNVQGGRRASHE
jgi:copper chaperone CopZ